MAPTFSDPGLPASEQSVQAFETADQVPLPSSYRRFLLETNGGKPSPSGIGGTDVKRLFSLNGERSFLDLEFAQGSFAPLPPAHIAIGRDPFGDAFVLDCRSGAVFRLDHERWEDEDCLSRLAPDFDSFLALLTDDDP